MSVKNTTKVAGGLAALASAAVLVFSQQGVHDLQADEGVAQKAYRDPVGIPTICTGSTRAVQIGHTATMAECDKRLREDTGVAGQAVARLVTHNVTQYQYDALVSFTFNVGAGNLASSTLLRKINAGDCMGAGAEFSRWHFAGGRSLPGLVTRRQGERSKWESGCASW